MARNMRFDVKFHPTKEVEGRTDVFDDHIREGGVVEQVKMGLLTKLRGQPGYRAFVYAGESGTVKIVENGKLFSTRSQAGHAVRQAFEAGSRSEKTAKTSESTSKTDGSAAGTLVSLEEAADRLCSGASNKMAALRKRISRGTIKTVDVSGVTMVDLGGEAA